ncbi:unnamed protein product [Brassica oleracea]
MSMRSAKSFGKSYVAVYFTNISPGTAESELGFRLIRFWETISTAKGGLLIGFELLLTGKQIYIMAAGTGSTALFTVICSFASRRVPFCANKFFKTVLGFSFVILLWAVDRLGRLWLLSWQQEQE